jgi:hypothetical protein
MGLLGKEMREMGEIWEIEKLGGSMEIEGPAVGV